MSLVDRMGQRVQPSEESPGIEETSDAEIRGLTALWLKFSGLGVPRISKVLGVGRSQVYLDMQRARVRLIGDDGAVESRAG